VDAAHPVKPEGLCPLAEGAVCLARDVMLLGEHHSTGVEGAGGLLVLRILVEHRHRPALHQGGHERLDGVAGREDTVAVLMVVP
jgi:hypothetical protein